LEFQYPYYRQAPQKAVTWTLQAITIFDGARRASRRLHHGPLPAFGIAHAKSLSAEKALQRLDDPLMLCYNETHKGSTTLWKFTGVLFPLAIWIRMRCMLIGASRIRALPMR
jgi:hypothetical protein